MLEGGARDADQKKQKQRDGVIMEKICDVRAAPRPAAPGDDDIGDEST